MKIQQLSQRFESLEERIAYKKKLYAEAKKHMEALEQAKSASSALVFYVIPSIIVATIIFITLLLRR